jgi:hypothetical protein
VIIVKGHPNLDKYALIQKTCYDYYIIGFQCFCFYPLGSIIYGYNNIFVSYIYSCWLNWPHKIKSPLHKWFPWKTCDQLCKTLNCQSSCSLTCITRFVLIMHISIHSWPPISNIQNLPLHYFTCKMPS